LIISFLTTTVRVDIAEMRIRIHCDPLLAEPSFHLDPAKTLYQSAFATVTVGAKYLPSPVGAMRSLRDVDHAARDHMTLAAQGSEKRVQKQSFEPA